MKKFYDDLKALFNELAMIARILAILGVFTVVVVMTFEALVPIKIGVSARVANLLNNVQIFKTSITVNR